MKSFRTDLDDLDDLHEVITSNTNQQYQNIIPNQQYQNNNNQQYPNNNTNQQYQNNCKKKVFRYDERTGIIPFNLNEVDPQNAMNMLLIGDVEEGEIGHYVLIRNFNKLNSKISKHIGEKHFCFRCLHAYTTREILEKLLEENIQTKPGEASILKLPV